MRCGSISCSKTVIRLCLAWRFLSVYALALLDCLYVAILGFVSGIYAAKGEDQCPSLCWDSDLVFSLVNAAWESEISGLSMFPQMACRVAMVFHGFVSQLSLVGILWGIPLFCFFSWSTGSVTFRIRLFYFVRVDSSFVRAILCCLLEDYCVSGRIFIFCR